MYGMRENIGQEDGKPDAFRPTDVAVYFRKAGQTVSDPYFDGEGPERTGCIGCGGCMLGCQHGSKNSLDQNYLYLAEARGLRLEADTKVTLVQPLEGGGYQVTAKQGRSIWTRKTVSFTARNVVFSGGVLGTVELLLKMRDDPQGLPNLSPRLGDGIRTNSEALIGIATPNRKFDLSEGIAITSILHTDEHSHVEPVRYGRGSGFFRLLIFLR